MWRPSWLASRDPRFFFSANAGARIGPNPTKALFKVCWKDETEDESVTC
jgi:hypothetical protein